MSFSPELFSKADTELAALEPAMLDPAALESVPPEPIDAIRGLRVATEALVRPN